MARKGIDRLPIFEGREPEKQKLKISGTVEKDKWAAEAHHGDTYGFVIAKVRFGGIDHDFTDDGMIRVEDVKILDAVIEPQSDDPGAIGKLFRDLARREADARAELSGQSNLDHADNGLAAANKAAKTAQGAAGTVDKSNVSPIGAKRASKAAKKTTKAPAKK